METNLAVKDFSYTKQEKSIANEFMNSAYSALLMLARNHRRRSRAYPTMMTEDVLHETYLKLSGQTVWHSYEHYMRTASLAMRQVIVDHARKKHSQKHGGGIDQQTYNDDDPVLPEFTETPEQILRINELLDQLENTQPRLAVIVSARYFAGLTESETAQALEVSERTVRRDWQAAKAWLSVKMEVEI